MGAEPATLAPMAPRSNPLYLLGCLSGTSSPHVILFLSLFYQHLTVLEILPRALPSTVFHFVSKLFHRCYAPADDFQGQSYYLCNTYPSFHSVGCKQCTLHVGAVGFEPTTSWSQTKRSNRAEPRPETPLKYKTRNTSTAS